MTKEIDPQLMGGTLEIPDCWYVHHVDFDSDTPSLNIAPASSLITGKDTKLPVPRALAYYLTTHFCGSQKMHDQLVEDGRQEVRNEIKDILKIGPQQ